MNENGIRDSSTQLKMFIEYYYINCRAIEAYIWGSVNTIIIVVKSSGKWHEIM